MRHVSTRAIILKKRNFGEHDQFITLFCPMLGTIDAVAKGSRKVTSSYIGHLELLNICRVQLYKTANRYTLTQCIAEETFKQLRNDLHRSVNGLLIVEIFQKTVHGGSSEGKELLELLEKTLTHLATTTKPLILIENFKVKLLQLCGSLPEISHCSQCHHKWDNAEELFIIGEGVILCIKCKISTNGATSISFNLMKLIHYFASTPLESSKKIRLNAEEIGALHKLTSVFLDPSLTAEIHTEKIRNQFMEEQITA